MSSNCRLLWLHGSWLLAPWELTSYLRTVVVATGSPAPCELCHHQLPYDTTLLLPAASAGSQPSGPRSPWSPVRQAPRSIASPIVELAEMEGGRSAIVLASVQTKFLIKWSLKIGLLSHRKCSSALSRETLLVQSIADGVNRRVKIAVTGLKIDYLAVKVSMIFIYLFHWFISKIIKQLQQRVYNTLTEKQGQPALTAFQIN